jgi:hypothetical protein
MLDQWRGSTTTGPTASRSQSTTLKSAPEVPVDLIAIDTTGKTGQLRFKATGTLSSTVDTDFYVYYGNGTATKPLEDATYGRENTWTSYSQVYAMEGASATAIIDRTANDRDVTSENNTPDYEQTGKLGKCVFCDDHAGIEYLSINSFSTSEYTTGIYMSAWVKLNGVGVNQQFLEVQVGSGGASFHCLGDDIRAQIYIVSTQSNLAADQMVANEWTHLATWWDGTNWKVLKNGVEVATKAQSGTATMDNGGTNQIGGDNGFYPQGVYSDQICVSSSTNTFSNDWVLTTYNNENSPSTFYTLGSEEAGGGGGGGGVGGITAFQSWT